MFVSSSECKQKGQKFLKAMFEEILKKCPVLQDALVKIGSPLKKKNENKPVSMHILNTLSLEIKIAV